MGILNYFLNFPAVTTCLAQMLFTVEKQHLCKLSRVENSICASCLVLYVNFHFLWEENENYTHKRETSLLFRISTRYLPKIEIIQIKFLTEPQLNI